MISASLSLSLPRLGWKSTSTPRSLKICTAAGESASEMRTLGFDMIVIPWNIESVVPAEAPLGAQSRDPYSVLWLWVPARASLGRDDRRGSSRLRQRGLGLGKGPVDPLREQFDIPCFDSGAAPDAQASRRVAVIREVEAGVFLFHQRHQLLGEVG